MSLTDKLQSILDTKNELKTIINEKGGTITDDTPFKDYPIQISNLSSSGGSDDKFKSLIDRSITEVTEADLSGLTSIGSSAFSYCTSLTSVTIGNSVKTIGSSAFSYCSKLTSVTIGNSVTSIGSLAFSNCTGLTNVEIPDSVNTIGDYAFENCRNLTSMSIPDGVTSIDYYAFSGCSSLTSVVIGDSVTSIYGNAFRNCSSLTSIEIPDGVTSIGNRVFYGCTSLNSISFNGTVNQWKSISKGTDWNKNVPATYVICSNGHASLTGGQDIILPG